MGHFYPNHSFPSPLHPSPHPSKTTDLKPLPSTPPGQQEVARSNTAPLILSKRLECQDGWGKTKWQPNYNLEDTADVKPGNYK